VTARSVLVSGGSRGIGLAVARRLQSQGSRVAVLSRKGESADGLLGIACDVRDADQITAAVAQAADAHGPVEVLVSNAGMSVDRLLLRLDDAELLEQLETNLLAAVRLTKAVAPGMARGRFGRLIYVGSVVASTGSAGQTAYATSKAGLIGLARSVARELAVRTVTANVVAPGPIDTDMTAALPDARRAAIAAAVPLQRFGTADEVAAVVAFLAGDEAGFVTGAVVPVDGGLGMGH
jgi:NAD(P)-dependent dehydrogenase (short-subunit alcohol dehydrogenase family)